MTSVGHNPSVLGYLYNIPYTRQDTTYVCDLELDGIIKCDMAALYATSKLLGHIRTRYLSVPYFENRNMILNWTHV